MNTASLRRSARIAARKAAENARKFTVSQPSISLEHPLIEELYGMLKIAEENTIKGVSLWEKLVHLTNIFEFILNKNMLNVVNSKVFENSVLTKMVEIKNTLKKHFVPYSLAIRFHVVSNRLMNRIMDSR